jgi:hypothetical protein
MNPTERLFVAHDKLALWVDQGKVTVDRNVLTLLAERKSYTLVEAVRFLRILGDEPDTLALLGKVRTKDQLKALNAEHMETSVIIGETAYEVQPGFVGACLVPRVTGRTHSGRLEVIPPLAPPSPAPAADAGGAHSIAQAIQGVSNGSVPATQPEKAPRSDAELLADFLLGNPVS